MVLGVGFDLVEVARVAALLDRWGERFTEKVFTEGERRYASGRAQAAQHLAARFAAKEAALKALGVPAGARWHELEVVSPAAGGKPALVLGGTCRLAADRLGAARFHLSLTHAESVAGAIVVLESRGEGA